MSKYRVNMFNLISIFIMILMTFNAGCKREKHYKKEYMERENSYTHTKKKESNYSKKRKSVEIKTKKSRVQETDENVRPKTTPVSSGEGAVYLIKPGDSLWKVSRMFHIPISYLVDYNDIEVDSPLRVGQEILIPSSLNATPPHKRRKKVSNSYKETKKKVKKKKLHRPKSSKFSWPLKGDVIRRFSSNFKGIEISSSKTTFVSAISSGEVIFADNMEGYGKLVIIDNLNGMFFIYGQLRTILLNNGDNVKVGQKVGRGGTPNVSGQNRVYFEIRKAPKVGADPKPVNPLRYLK